MSVRATALRVVIASAVIVLALGVGLLINRLREGESGINVASPTARPTVVVSPPIASQTPSVTSSPIIVTFCGAVTGYAADGAHMLLTLTSGATTQQFNLQYQFAKSPPPTDIGDRLARGERQLLRVDGRQVEPDSGSPNAITLRDYTVVRVGSCP